MSTTKNQAKKNAGTKVYIRSFASRCREKEKFAVGLRVNVFQVLFILKYSMRESFVPLFTSFLYYILIIKILLNAYYQNKVYKGTLSNTGQWSEKCDMYGNVTCDKEISCEESDIDIHVLR